ncbi:hypothetical protein L6654_28030 [Bradyrhizobium sp. WYCCWR 13023]|jgi:hypothetical protein|uniref:Uncharacterized protein n=1 Tax=Bradyrhizobium zhengyangense TaxID=2911009 RepID=A0A9X1RDI3_9BRAD|nr:MULTISPECIES: hypothetical protein [Bradyrhizobium]MCG2630486.1 hypothetical protein [Bradyrhizobium zhengyangense]
MPLFEQPSQLRKNPHFEQNFSSKYPGELATRLCRRVARCRARISDCSNSRQNQFFRNQWDVAVLRSAKLRDSVALNPCAIKDPHTLSAAEVHAFDAI